MYSDTANGCAMCIKYCTFIHNYVDVHTDSRKSNKYDKNVHITPFGYYCFQMRFAY